MSIIPHDTPKYQHTKTRFFEREHGIEFTKLEFEQMKKFRESRKHDRVEITGCVVWSKPPYFLQTPTSTTANASIVCKVEDGLPYPDLNQYSTIRGSWIHDIIQNKLVKVLLVTDIDKTRHDFGKIKPDISPKDFSGIMFENWRNVSDATKTLIAHDFIGSPTFAAQRTGGFTLTLASYSKSNALSMFLDDLNRFIPDDFTKNRSLSFKIPELGVMANLPKFGWDSNVANVEKIPKNINVKLERIPKNLDECSITLLQKTMGPFNFDSRGLVKSDYPLILEEHVERTRVVYDVDPEIYKFVIATRLSTPTVSLDTYNQGMKKNRERLDKMSETFETLSTRTGDGQFLDLGYKGKPLSIHNLALSFGRSGSLDSVSLDGIEKASDVYFENMDDVMKIQDVWGYGHIPASAVLSTEERRTWACLLNNPNSSADSIAENMALPPKNIQKTIGSLLLKSTIIESEFGKYTAVSQK